MAARAWVVTAASVRGPDHAREERPRQDACWWRAEGDRLVAAVADGAGSAPMSRAGARLCSTAVVDVLFASGPPPLANGEDPIRGAIEAAVQTARSLTAHCVEAGAGASMRDYAATVVGVWAEGASGCLFHIGDGAAAAARDEDLGDPVVSPPENGEFAEETYFYTDKAWRTRLRITPFSERDLVVLASDGAGSFAFAPRWRGLEAEFIGPLARHLARCSPTAGRRTLARVLHAPEARAISGDDKTLLLARLRGGG